MNEPLHFALFFSAEHPPSGGFHPFRLALKDILLEIDWVWCEERPDLLAIFQLQQFPCLVAWNNDWRRVAAIVVDDVGDLASRVKMLQTAWEEKHDELLSLLSKDEEISTQNFEITTLLVREWFDRIITNWSPVITTPLERNDVTTALLLSRFRQEPDAMSLWEHFWHKLRSLDPIRLSLSEMVILIEVAARHTIIAAEQGAVQRLEILADSVQQYFVPETGYYEYSNKVLDETLDELHPTCATSPAQQAEVAYSFLQIGWVLGIQWWKAAENLLENVWRDASFSIYGCKGKLINADSPDFDKGDKGDLCDFIQFFKASLHLYNVTGDARWLSRAETVAALTIARYQAPTGALDWFPVNSVIHGRTPALRETGIMAEVSIQLSRITNNPEWERIADQLLGSLGVEILRKPLASVSLVSAIIYMFQRDITLRVDWQQVIPTDWRIVLSEWWNELRIDWRNPSPSGVLVSIGTQSEPLTNPMTLQRMFTKGS
ncbi:MAG: hypothetical protein OEM52_14330 [bacterium]|nr:hypothetical protein [bacterium]